MVPKGPIVDFTGAWERDFYLISTYPNVETRNFVAESLKNTAKDQKEACNYLPAMLRASGIFLARYSFISTNFQIFANFFCKF